MTTTAAPAAKSAVLAATSVVVVLHNSADGLEPCLESLPREVELVVVDNASTDAGPEIARRSRPDATVLALGENVGFGAGCNVGARAASRDVLVFLNPDTVVVEGALEKLGVAVLGDPACVVGP